ncbi:gamma-glutamyltransferase [Candidatus Marinamargulisbacteria bacterium SCGC AAA071-K20]|nr:gamma-glutamyltransferase [Candidatus Marinamargulisbacteria bacterium SCGC AAA071-K20]
MKSYRFSFFLRLIIFLFFLPSFLYSQLDDPIYDYYDRFHPVVGEQGMVATQEKKATQIGLDVLKNGGNAVDSAYAIAYALAVTLPRAGNIGGGGFMMIYSAKDKQVYAIDYREKAPQKATANMFLDVSGNVNEDLSRYSILSVGVPGTVAGFEHVLKRFGTKKRKVLIAPAILLAENGIVVGKDLSESLKRAKPRMMVSPAAMKIFYKKKATFYEPGDILVQKDLSKTLKMISSKGSKSFYNGTISKEIAKYMKNNNGLITRNDFKSYSIKERTPVKGSYKGLDVYSMPPPSSGGVHLIQLLNILEQFSLSELGHNSADSIHLYAEAMRVAYADRSKYMGDPGFVNVPSEMLTSKSVAHKIAASISLDKAGNSNTIYPGRYFEPKEGNETTHFTIMDKFGNVVSNTYTLNFSDGSKLVVPGTGILLNNQMDDFSAKPGVANAYGLIGSEANSIAPGKRMLSSMTPTIVFKDGLPTLATGSPGGSRIITTVLQLVLNTIEFDLNIAEATVAPRVHHQWKPDEIRIEKGISQDTIKRLKDKGHIVVTKRAMGSSQSIVKKGNYFYGYSDPRKPNSLTLGY